MICSRTLLLPLHSLLVQRVSLGLGHDLDLACSILTSRHWHPLALLSTGLQNILELLRAGAAVCASSGLRCWVFLQRQRSAPEGATDISLRALCALSSLLRGGMRHGQGQWIRYVLQDAAFTQPLPVPTITDPWCSMHYLSCNLSCHMQATYSRAAPTHTAGTQTRQYQLTFCSSANWPDRLLAAWIHISTIPSRMIPR